MIDKLIEIIGQEATVFAEFLSLLEEQKQALVRNDIPLIENTTARQREKLTQSHNLNREREEIVALIRIENDFIEDCSVNQLLELADANQSERLIQLQDIILDLHEQIEKTRNSNALLLNQSREFISRTMSMLCDMNRPAGNYTSTGKSSDTQVSLIMDRRV